MAEQKQIKHGGSRKFKRNEAKCSTYKAHQTREKNKIKRILQSNGLKAATIYATKYGLKVPKQE
jgi:hypothetical protein